MAIQKKCMKLTLVQTIFILEDAFWSILYPDSIVKIDNLLYIGMRGGIASYNLDTGELLWYEQVVEED